MYSKVKDWLIGCIAGYLFDPPKQKKTKKKASRKDHPVWEHDID